ncbi:MAG TPA: STAS domain-containing protein [Pseudonocardiaceae bacterium]|nr:STAS domain-containing protein [Pseudonocardiaceae bacterium]
MNGFDGVDANEATAVGTEDMATVTVEHLPDAIVVKVAGEIDMMTAPAMEDAVRRSLAERPANLVIDLTGARFFSSAGIAVLVLAHRNSADVALRVVASDRVVLRPLELTGLTDDLAIYPTLTAALDT